MSIGIYIFFHRYPWCPLQETPGWEKESIIGRFFADILAPYTIETRVGGMDDLIHPIDRVLILIRMDLKEADHKVFYSRNVPHKYFQLFL